MPAKKKGGARKRKVGGRKMVPQSAKGFFDFIKKAANTIGDVAKAAAPAIAKSGIVGNLASRINPGVGSVVKAAGLGRRRRRRVARHVGRGPVTSETVKVMAF